MVKTVSWLLILRISCIQQARHHATLNQLLQTNGITSCLNLEHQSILKLSVALINRYVGRWGNDKRRNIINYSYGA